jgi:hypothetical protein
MANRIVARAVSPLGLFAGVVRWDAEWEEYTAHVAGQAGDGYHTDDKQDALDTLRYLLATLEGGAK